MTARPRTTVLAGLALGTLLLAGCGAGSDNPAVAGSSSSSAKASYGPAASGPHNAADVTFATDMLPHHAQAVEMADMALGRDTDARVKELAMQIKAAQAPEIARMSGWLVGWGAAVPTSMSGMDHGSGSTAEHGMMSGASMTSLNAASGTEFAKQFLAGMLEHHRGAVAMAEIELKEGTNADAKKLAQSIIDTQNVEIATMTALLPKIS